MSLAPDNQLLAALAVLKNVILGTRVVGWRLSEDERACTDPRAREHIRQIAALMDAVHNIPAMIRQWESSKWHREHLLPRLEEHDREFGTALAQLYVETLKAKS